MSAGALDRDLSDVDVIVPVRIDSDDRLENLDVALEHLAESFDGLRVWVLEHARSPQARDCASKRGARYHFIESAGCFHKSRVLNLGIALTDRPYVLVYDCDVLLPPPAVVEARRRLRDGALDFIYPYNGLLLQIGRERVRGAKSPAAVLADLPACVESRSAKLPEGVEFLHGSEDEPSSGAALMASRRRLVLAGGYNENIVSYGCEDTELASRLEKLGERMAWLDGFCAYHVAHRRGEDSHYNNYHSLNLAEWNKVRAMDRDRLAAYVRNGFRELALDAHGTLDVINTPAEFSLRLRDAAAVALDDVAFVLALPAASTALRAWVDDFLVRLDAAYDNFELFLVEIGGYTFQPLAHRDHVLFVHAASAAEAAWLGRAVEQTSRPILCVCSPFTDLSPAALLGAVDAVRAAGGTSARAVDAGRAVSGASARAVDAGRAVSATPARGATGQARQTEAVSPVACASVPSQPPAALSAARGGKIAEVLLRSLPATGDALVFARDTYLASLAGADAAHDNAAANAHDDASVKTPSAERDSNGTAKTFDLGALRRRLEAAAARIRARTAGAQERDLR